MSWLTLSLVTLALWGLWGIVAKLASQSLGWRELFVAAGVSSAITTLVAYFLLKPNISMKEAGFYYALLAGVAGSVGAITFYLALTEGKASTVVPLTALYPLVTIVLSFLILGEKITLIQGLGIVLALVSILLMAL